MTLQLAGLSTSIAVGHLATPLDGAAVITPTTPVRSARRLLDEGQFDQAPVIDGGVPIGYVLAGDLPKARGGVVSVMKPILPRALVGHSTPLVDALPWLEATRFLFLLEGQRVSGFIVPSDLNRQAGRSYFYLGLVELELRLAALVRAIDTSERVLGTLGPARADQLRKNLEKSRKKNTEVDAVAEMYLPDLFDVAGKLSKLPDTIGVGRGGWADYWRPIRTLRNRISHASGPILQTPAQLEDILEADRRTHRLIGALDGVA